MADADIECLFLTSRYLTWLYIRVLPIRANIRAWQAEAYAALGEFGSALAVAGEAQRIASELGNPHTQGFAGVHSGYVLLMQGQHEAAARAYERGLASGGSRGGNSLGPALTRLLLGHREDGLRTLAQGLEIVGNPFGPWPRTLNRYGVVVAGAYLAAGLPEEAETVASRGLALALHDDARAYHVPLGRLRAEALALQGKEPRGDQALSDWGRLIDVATDLSMRPELAHCHFGFGKLYCRTGDGAKAREHLANAAALYREMAMGFWLEKAEAPLGAAP